MSTPARVRANDDFEAKMAKRDLTRRRFLQFRLRTLLMFVAALSVGCAYLGRQAMIVRERKALIDLPSYALEFKTKDDIVCYRSGDVSRIPWIRRLLGDQAIGTIALPIGTEIALRHRIGQLFPEAEVKGYRPPFIFSGPGYGSVYHLAPFPDSEEVSTSASR